MVFRLNKWILRAFPGLLLVPAPTLSAAPDMMRVDLRQTTGELAETLSFSRRLTVEEASLTEEERVRDLLRRRGLDRRIRLHSIPGSLQLLGGGKSRKYEYAVNGIPLCELSFRASAAPGKTPLLLGPMPGPLHYEPVPEEEWPSAEAALQRLQETAAEMGKEPLIPHNSRRCYLLDETGLHPVYEMTVRSGGLYFIGKADEDRTWMWDPRFFHVDAVTTVYEKNSTSGDLRTYNLGPMIAPQKDQGDKTNQVGYLSNQYFETIIHSGSPQDYAFAADGIFSFAAGTSEFDETSIFANTNRTLSWFLEHSWDKVSTVNRITLIVHAIISAGDKNNALYQPVDSTNAIIYIGDGDGRVLQNLATDADVVSHEFSHHVIFQTLTSTRGESLVLHEGLADFFTFLRTGDTCLGESICPEGSPIRCTVESTSGNTCLRSADNDLRYDSTDLHPEAHLRGQLISGYMWDMHVGGDGVDPLSDTDLMTLALGAIARLPESAKYTDLIAALIQTDNDLFGGKHCPGTIWPATVNRGLNIPVNGNFSCDSSFPLTPAQNDSTEEKKSGNNLCGVVPGSRGNDARSWLTALLLGMPLMFGLVKGRRPEPVAIRGRHRKQRTRKE